MLDVKETNGVASVAMLTLSEVASLLKVHPNSVRRWTKLGLLKCYRLGVRGDRRFKVDEIDEFLGNGAGRAKA